VTPNAAPVVEAVTGPILPVQLGSGPVTINATFSDLDVPQSTPYAATINWGDNTGAIAATVLANPSTGVFGTVRGTHTYSAAGVYTVTVTVNDKIPGTGSRTYEQYVVVYDPAGGFVTGGGWINSPAGAYAPNPALGGKATFGFVSKYQKGATAPSGNTQFQFHAAGMDFKSTNYEWLVISGARAQYKGSGTINGSGDYGFILTAVEGDMPGGGGTDRFRIKIVNRATNLVVYDNQLATTDDAGLTSPGTLLGGGSIQIQSK